MRTAEIYVFDKFAGNLVEDDYGTFTFQYEAAYLEDSLPVAVSCTMPLKSEPYVSNSLFPFFDGLIPEGWLLADRFNKLVKCNIGKMCHTPLCGTGSSMAVAKGDRRG